MNILITSIGGKIDLVQAFMRIPREFRGSVNGIDAQDAAAVPAAAYCDQFVRVPGDNDRGFQDSMRSLIQHYAIGLVVPTRDEELLFWADFAQNETEIAVAVASPECIAVCRDKWQTAKWLKRHGLPTPDCFTVQGFKREVAASPKDFPWIAKDPKGSGSKGIHRLEAASQIAAISEDWLLQKVLPGQEYTINLYVDRSGACRCVVPHRRDRVIGGEVAAGETVQHHELIELAHRLVQTLPPLYGPLNFQVFWEGAGTVPQIIDINPRLGGGYLLCHAAGGCFVDWLVLEAIGEPPRWEQIVWQAGIRLDRSCEPMLF